MMVWHGSLMPDQLPCAPGAGPLSCGVVWVQPGMPSPQQGQGELLRCLSWD